LVFAGTDRSGTVRFVQIIYLTKDGVKISKAEAIARELPPNAKQVHGVMPDAFIRFPGPATAPLLHGEGAETGLSLWVSTGHETRLSAGANPRNQPEAGRINVVCRDDDKHQSPADKALKAALVKWKSEGHNVRVATPWHIRRCDKSDFNDVIQADGIPAVQDRIIAALGTAHKPVNRMTADESRTALLTFISALFAEAAKWRTAMLTVDPGQSIPPYPVHGIAVDVGAGKTQIALEFIPKTVEAMRANGDKSSIVIAIPEHALGDEQMARLAAMPGGNKITAAVWRSRQAKIGDGSETKMCLDPDAVKDAELAMADVQTAVCRKKQKDGTFKECPIVPDAHG
jgi:hypothetical protein